MNSSNFSIEFVLNFTSFFMLSETIIFIVPCESHPFGICMISTCFHYYFIFSIKHHDIYIYLFLFVLKMNIIKFIFIFQFSS